MLLSTQPTIDRQKKFWDWHWQNWQDRKTINGWKDKRHEKVLEFVKSLSLNHARVLDVGCGPGWYTTQLSAFGSVTGIDLSEEAIAMATIRFPHVTFVAGNIYEYPLPSEEFDLVVSQEVIDHVEDSAKFVDRVADVIKPGGYFILSCTNKFVVDRLDEREFPPNPPDHIGRYFNRKTLKRLLTRRFHFLRAETILPMGHRGVLRFANSQKLNGVLGRFLSTEQIDRIKGTAGLGYQIVVIAQKRT